MYGIWPLRVMHVDLFGDLETERILHAHTYARCRVSKDVQGRDHGEDPDRFLHQDCGIPWEGLAAPHGS